jgi:GTP-binding protein SAR1
MFTVQLTATALSIEVSSNKKGRGSKEEQKSSHHVVSLYHNNIIIYYFNYCVSIHSSIWLLTTTTTQKEKQQIIMSSILSYFKSFIQSILKSLGLYKKQGTILLLGLDNAGKTTLLHKLRTNTIVHFAPTEKPHQETFYMDNSIKFIGWDLGGHEAVRKIWDDFVIRDNIDAILFMIDAADYQRFEEVKDELDALVNDSDSGLKYSGVPLAILLNKCDLENAQSTNVIAQEIGYHDIIDGYTDRYNDDEDEDEDEDYNIDTNANDEKELQGHHQVLVELKGEEMVKLFRISVWSGQGYVDAFQWISTFLRCT